MDVKSLVFVIDSIRFSVSCDFSEYLFPCLLKEVDSVLFSSVFPEAFEALLLRAYALKIAYP
jgi:hypothetical protein